jgi:glycosyltransferase involved in cell wall biosynthesis
LIINKTILNIKLPTSESVYAKKREIAEKLYRGWCWGCHKFYENNFAFHHIEYDPLRKTHKDFPNTVNYNRYIIPEVIAYPERFRLACKVCHARNDQPRYGYLGHMKKDKLIRVFIMAFETIPKPRGKNGGDFPPISSPNCLENSKKLETYIIDEINNLKTFLATYTER